MKTIPQIENDIKARQAELDSLNAEHRQDVMEYNKATEAFQSRFIARKAKAHHLEGIIEGLTSLLPKPEGET